tara:strand:- start:850 stop:1143 length:294 start_codon:yes stop_codon:yes gene_type:complete
MKLPKITCEDPIVNVKAKMRQSKVKLIDEYKEMYKTTYGENLETGTFLEHIAEQFISGDKEFAAFLKKQSAVKTEAKVEAKPAPKNVSNESQPTLDI